MTQASNAVPGTACERPEPGGEVSAAPHCRADNGGGSSRLELEAPHRRREAERVGYEWVHSLVDDHSRLAYSELHRDERAATVTGFVERGLAFYAAHGIEAKRLLSDNAFVYRQQPLTRASCSPGTRSGTASSGRAARRPTGRSSASSRP